MPHTTPPLSHDFVPPSLPRKEEGQRQDTATYPRLWDGEEGEEGGDIITPAYLGGEPATCPHCLPYCCGEGRALFFCPFFFLCLLFWFTTPCYSHPASVVACLKEFFPPAMLYCLCEVGVTPVYSLLPPQEETDPLPDFDFLCVALAFGTEAGWEMNLPHFVLVYLYYSSDLASVSIPPCQCIVPCPHPLPYCLRAPTTTQPSPTPNLFVFCVWLFKLSLLYPLQPFLLQPVTAHVLHIPVAVTVAGNHEKPPQPCSLPPPTTPTPHTHLPSPTPYVVNPHWLLLALLPSTHLETPPHRRYPYHPTFFYPSHSCANFIPRCFRHAHYLLSTVVLCH